MRRVRAVVMGVLSVCAAVVMVACDEPSIEGAALAKERLELLETLQPTRLEADLNGDGVMDRILFVMDKGSHKRGLCILHGGAHRCVVLGAGHPFFNGGDDFKWLEHSSIAVDQDEGSGGVITYVAGHYRWIHRGD